MLPHPTDWMDYAEYDRGLYLTPPRVPDYMQLAAKCILCGHRVRVHRNWLLRTIGRDVFMINVHRKLKCGLCTNRRHNRLLCRIVVP